MNRTKNNIAGININAIINNSEVKQNISKEDLIKFIQKGAVAANNRIKRIENKYGRSAKSVSIQYKNVKDRAFEANKKSERMGKIITEKGILPSGRFSKETKGMDYTQLSMKAKHIGYFLKSKTSTIEGINEHWGNIQKGIKESRAFKEDTKKYLLSLDKKKLSKLWNLIDHGDKYDSDTVINIIQKMENGGVSQELMQKALDEMFDNDLTENQMLDEVAEHIDEMREGNYKYNKATTDITEDLRNETRGMF